jgi:hypothetical protein
MTTRSLSPSRQTHDLHTADSSRNRATAWQTGAGPSPTPPDNSVRRSVKNNLQTTHQEGAPNVRVTLNAHKTRTTSAGPSSTQPVTRPGAGQPNQWHEHTPGTPQRPPNPTETFISPSTDSPRTRVLGPENVRAAPSRTRHGQPAPDRSITHSVRRPAQEVLTAVPPSGEVDRRWAGDAKTPVQRTSERAHQPGSGRASRRCSRCQQPPSTQRDSYPSGQPPVVQPARREPPGGDRSACEPPSGPTTQSAGRSTGEPAGAKPSGVPASRRASQSARPPAASHPARVNHPTCGPPSGPTTQRANTQCANQPTCEPASQRVSRPADHSAASRFSRQPPPADGHEPLSSQPPGGRSGRGPLSVRTTRRPRPGGATTHWPGHPARANGRPPAQPQPSSHLVRAQPAACQPSGLPTVQANPAGPPSVRTGPRQLPRRPSVRTTCASQPPPTSYRQPPSNSANASPRRTPKTSSPHRAGTAGAGPQNKPQPPRGAVRRRSPRRSTT